MFVIGVLLKLIDDVFDEGLLTENAGMFMSVLVIPMFWYVLLDLEGFILAGSIFWTTLPRGKVDNPGFYLGFGGVAAGWGLLYFLQTPFPLGPGLLIGLGIAILSIVVTTVLHDRFQGSGGPLWNLLVEERFLIVVLDLPLLIMGIVSPLGILAILLLVGGYSLGRRTAPVLDRIHGGAGTRTTADAKVRGQQDA